MVSSETIRALFVPSFLPSNCPVTVSGGNKTATRIAPASAKSAEMRSLRYATGHYAADEQGLDHRSRVTRVTVTIARRLSLTVGMFTLLAGPLASAQDSFEPRQFAEFRGAWTLDEKATADLRPGASRTGGTTLYDVLGFPVARKLVIATTPTEITVTKDSALPELYRFDGSETQVRDPRTNAPLLPVYRFTLVAGTLALTTKTTRDRTTEIITDAYSMPEWTVLKVERQLSILAPEGFLRSLSRLRNFPQTMTYRRAE